MPRPTPVPDVRAGNRAYDEVDRALIRKAAGRDDLDVFVVPRAASNYFCNAKPTTLEAFTGSVSWA
jgi:hypothetical protein